MGLYERIKKAAAEKGYSINRLEKELKYPRSSISKYNKNNPGIDKIKKIASFLDVPIETILEDDSEKEKLRPYAPFTQEYYQKHIVKELNNMPKNPPVQIVKRVPVLGKVAAGIPIEAIQEILDYEEISGPTALDGEYFGLVINGDSMEPKFSRGDVVIVRQQSDADDGDVVVAIINGDDAVCKVLRKYEDGIALVSTNPAYQPMYFSRSEIEKLPVRIIGKVKELRAKF